MVVLCLLRRSLTNNSKKYNKRKSQSLEFFIIAEMNLRTPKMLRIGEAQPNCVRATLECGARRVGEADFSSAFQSHCSPAYAHHRIRVMRDLKAEMNLRTPKMLRIGEAQPGVEACAASKLFARRFAKP